MTQTGTGAAKIELNTELVRLLYCDEYVDLEVANGVRGKESRSRTWTTL